jgi:hypothetical protein
MATFEMVPCGYDPASTDMSCKSTKVDPDDPTGSKLIRNIRFTGYGNLEGVQQDCIAYGVGYGAINKSSGGAIPCYYPCPPSYETDPSDTSKCVPRPLLTSVDIYYRTLNDSAKSCLEKSAAYKQAVMESGNDPSAFPFPAECPNPYSCEEGAFANSTDLPPMPDNTGTTVPASSDPNGSSGVAGSNNGNSVYSQLLCKAGQWEPFIPTPPYNPTLDSSGGVGEPSSRLTLTVEDIDKIPLESEYGSAGRKSALAQELYNRPTLLDIYPDRIKDYMVYDPAFVWSATVTQENFDKMPQAIQCALVNRYFDQITNPSKVEEMRSYDATILISRDAPPTSAPVFVNDIETKLREECEARSNRGYGGCKWRGNCEGFCECPDPPPNWSPDAPPTSAKQGDNTPMAEIPDAPPDPESASFVLIGGIAVGAIVLLVVGYQVFKVASPTGRAISAFEGGANVGGIRISA